MGYLRKVLFIVLFVLSACGLPNGRDIIQDGSDLNLSFFEIRGENNTIFLKMNPSGQIVDQNGQEAGLINSQGLAYGVDGVLVAKLTDNGLLETPSGERMVRVSKEGALDNGSGSVIHWSDNGRLFQDDVDTGIKISPPDSSARRAASIAIFLYLSFFKAD